MLIIDDEEDDRYLLKEPLSCPGAVSHRGGRDGADGLRRAREERPDVIFLDLVMPDMTGFEVLDRLKADDADEGHPGHPQHLEAVLGEDERRRLTAGTVAVLRSPPAVRKSRSRRSVRP